MSLATTDLVEMYRLMLLTRRFEEKSAIWFQAGRIREMPHSSIGQEAIGVGACYGLRPDDYVMPSLRTRAALFTRGWDLNEMVSTMCAKATGISGGRNSSHHAGIPEKGILLGSGIVGASIAVATGAALGLKFRGSDAVVVDFFGDGASNRGDFHEALNMAGLYKLPIVYVCENNGWAETMPIESQMAVQDIAIRAKSYGFPGVIVDGNDVVEVHMVVSDAVARARVGEGPTLIEAKTARICGHCEDPLFIQEAWRPGQDKDEARARDPLPRFASYLQSRELLGTPAMEEMDRQIAADLARALLYAEACPDPSLEDAENGVYAVG